MRILLYFRRFLAYLLGIVDRRVDSQPQLPEAAPAPAGPTRSELPVSQKLETSPGDSAQPPNSESAQASTSSADPSGEQLRPAALPAAASAIVDTPDKPTTSPPVRVVASETPSADPGSAVKLDVATAAVPVRRFFARIVTRASTGTAHESWPTMPVERFFLAVTRPKLHLLPSRGSALVDPQSVGDAFSDFVWD